MPSTITWQVAETVTATLGIVTYALAYCPTTNEYLVVSYSGGNANCLFVNLSGSITGSAVAFADVPRGAVYVPGIDKFIVFGQGARIARIDPATRTVSASGSVSSSWHKSGAALLTNEIFLADNSDGRFINASTLTEIQSVSYPNYADPRGAVYCSTSGLVAVITQYGIHFVNAVTRAYVDTVNISDIDGGAYVPELDLIFLIRFNGQNITAYTAATRNLHGSISNTNTNSSGSIHFNETTGYLFSSNAARVFAWYDPVTLSRIASFTPTGPTGSTFGIASGEGTLLLSPSNSSPGNASIVTLNYLLNVGAVKDNFFTVNRTARKLTLQSSGDYVAFNIAADRYPMLGGAKIFVSESTLTGTLNGDLELSGNADLTADGIVLMAASKTLTLGAKSSYTLKAAIPAAGNVVANRDVEILGLTFAIGATLNKASGVPGTITVTVASTAGITAGPGVVLSAPISQIILTGIPTVPGALVGVINLTTMVPSFPAVSAGAATIPTDPATNYLIAVDAPGWVRQQVVLSGATPSFALDWAGRDYRALYDQGDPLYEGIELNYSTFAVTVDQSKLAIDPATAFRRIEDLLATPEAIFFANPPQPLVVEISETVAEYYLVFPYDQANDVVNPVVIRPHPANTQDIALVGFAILLRGAADPFYDIFDFTQQPNGRIIRINTKSTFVQNLVSGGLSSADRAVIDAIATATAEIPTVPEFEARTIPSSEYSTLVEETIAALLQAALEGLSTGGLGPEDIDRLIRIENQLIADIIKGATRYKRLLPGTETVILDKDVTFEPEVGYILTEHQEPPP